LPAPPSKPLPPFCASEEVTNCCGTAVLNTNGTGLAGPIDERSSTWTMYM
jgi:hypothetical protein